MHNNRKTILPNLRQIPIGEPDANSEFFSALRSQNDPIFLKCFYQPPHFPSGDFELGKKYIVYGQKGTGKTSVLRHLNKQHKDGKSEFVIFRRTVMEEVDLQDFSKLPLILDENEVKNIKHYYHAIKRLLVLLLIRMSISDNEKHDDSDSIQKSVDSESLSIISRIWNSAIGDVVKIGLDSVHSVFNSLGVDLSKTTSERVLIDGGKLLKRQNDDLLKYLLRRQKRTLKKLRLFLDEIHFAYRSTDSLQQDAMLVRDVILAIQALNDRFAEEGIDVIIYAAIRSEYLEHPIIATADVNHAIESVGFELTYSNFHLNRDHPLFDLAFLRFKAVAPENFTKKQFIDNYCSGVDVQTFLERTWSKPRDLVRYFKCAQNLYPNKYTLSTSESNAVWRNYSQAAWKEIQSTASPFLTPDAIQAFSETLAEIAPAVFDGSAKYTMKSFGEKIRGVYETAKKGQKNFYSFEHFLRLLYIIGIFSTRRRDANNQEIFHSYHRGNKNYHTDGEVLLHPSVLKAFG